VDAAEAHEDGLEGELALERRVEGDGLAFEDGVAALP
jgi:hypothetical protein